MKLEFSRQIFEKYSNIKCHYLFHTDGRTGMTKLIAAFRNITNARKNLIIRKFSLFLSISQCTIYQPILVADLGLIVNHLKPLIQGGARNVIPLIVHVTHFYYYKNI